MKSPPTPGARRPPIRLEQPGDIAEIGALTAIAFARPPPGVATEPRIVEALREAGALSLSLVAVGDGGALVGHVAFSPVTIDGRPGDWYALGPISVAPPVQRQGIGSALMAEGLARLRALGADGCVLLGSPAYYGRFGFLSDETLTYQGKPNRFFQRLVLRGAPPVGDGDFHPAFGVA